MRTIIGLLDRLELLLLRRLRLLPAWDSGALAVPGLLANLASSILEMIFPASCIKALVFSPMLIFPTDSANMEVAS